MHGDVLNVRTQTFRMDTLRSHTETHTHTQTHAQTHTDTHTVWPENAHRRLEVVVDGLPLFRGPQLAIDTMVFPVRSDGTARRQCATTSGARRRKERTYPELSQPHGRARFGLRGGGTLVRDALLAAAKARSEPTMLCWLRRWSTLMACAAASAFSLSLLERRCCSAADGASHVG